MKDVKMRVNRIIGQLHGIEKMVDQKRDCTEILQQVAAVKKAIDGLSKEIVVSNICQFLPQENITKVGQMIERAINL